MGWDYLGWDGMDWGWDDLGMVQRKVSGILGRDGMDLEMRRFGNGAKADVRELGMGWIWVGMYLAMECI